MAHKNTIGLLVILLVTFAVFMPALGGEFTNWEDPAFVLENPLIRPAPLTNFHKILRTPVQGRLYPLTFLTYQIEYHLFGMVPFWFHLTNIILHMANVALVFYLMMLLRLPRAAALLTALLFAVHPLQVEAVAWISGRKDLLAALFLYCGIGVYLKESYAPSDIGQPLGSRGGAGFMGVISGFMLLSLLCKPLAVTLPFVLLVIDYYETRRVTRFDVLSKWPLYILSLVFGLLTARVADRAGGFPAREMFSWMDRGVLSLYAVWQYLCQIVSPAHLSALYSFPGKNGGLFMPAIYAQAVAAVLVLGMIFQRATPPIRAALGFFLMTIFPVLHIVRMNTAPMYDRFMYVPMLGVVVLIVAAVWQVMVRQRRWRPVVAVIIAAYLASLMVVSRDRVAVWHDSRRLWNDVLAQDPFNVDALINRADVNADEGLDIAALRDLNLAVSLAPQRAFAYFNRAGVYAQQQDFDRAVADYNKALDRRFRDPSLRVAALTNRGVSRAMAGDYEGALADYDAAIRLSDDPADLLLNKALALFKLMRYHEALAALDAVIRVRPDHSLAFYLRGKILAEGK